MSEKWQTLGQRDRGEIGKATTANGLGMSVNRRPSIRRGEMSVGGYIPVRCGGRENQWRGKKMGKKRYRAKWVRITGNTF